MSDLRSQVSKQAKEAAIARDEADVSLAAAAAANEAGGAPPPPSPLTPELLEAYAGKVAAFVVSAKAAVGAAEAAAGAMDASVKKLAG